MAGTFVLYIINAMYVVLHIDGIWQVADPLQDLQRAPSAIEKGTSRFHYGVSLLHAIQDRLDRRQHRFLLLLNLQICKILCKAVRLT